MKEDLPIRKHRGRICQVVFARWYGPKGDPVYIERALKALASEYFIKILDNKKFEALS
jgi:hypothetical protein